MVSIKGLDKAEVLLALYNASHIQGMGFLSAVSNYSIEDAREDIENRAMISTLTTFMAG